MNTKKFIQILAVSATALITACEEQFTSFEGETPITVSTLVSEKTRAGYDKDNLPKEFVMDINQGDANYNYSLVTMVRDNNTTSSYKEKNGALLLWKGAIPHDAEVKALTKPTESSINANQIMTVKVLTNQTTNENVQASDLLGAKSWGDNAGITINNDDISIAFSHLLSKLQVTYKFADTSNNPKVNYIKLNHVCIQGGYSYAQMDYDNSISSEFNNITMFHNSGSKTAEAIFFPHNPDNLILEVNVTFGRNTRSLECPIQLKAGKTFEGGKLYTMEIKINGGKIEDAYITTVKDWISDSGSMTNKKILWVGTSIPAGAVGNNYPDMIAAATGYEIVNKSVSGSSVCIVNNPKWTPGWKTKEDVLNPLYHVHTLNLGATPEEMKTQWYDQLNEIRKSANEPMATLDAWMEFIYGYSYVNMIIPYINGEKDNCNVLVIDHGFNDRLYIAQECNGHKLESKAPYGLTWLDQLATGTSYRDDYNLGVASYFVCMNRMIKDCIDANPNLKIIIGNYFAQSVPVFDNAAYGVVDQGGASAAKLIVKANEAVAAMNHLDIVNVYKYTGLDDANSHGLYNTLVPIDGVHPVNDPLGRLNRIIANIYLERFKEIFEKEQ